MFDVQNASSAGVQHDASHGDRHALQSFRTFHITHIEACGTYDSNDTITVETMCHLFHACALRMPGVIQQGSTAMEMAKIATWKIHEQRCGPLQNSDWRRLVSANACPVLSIDRSAQVFRSEATECAPQCRNRCSDPRCGRTPVQAACGELSRARVCGRLHARCGARKSLREKRFSCNVLFLRELVEAPHAEETSNTKSTETGERKESTRLHACGAQQTTTPHLQHACAAARLCNRAPFSSRGVTPAPPSACP